MTPRIMGFLFFVAMVIGIFSLATGIGTALFFFLAGLGLLAVARHAYNRNAGDWQPLTVLGIVMIFTSIGEAIS